MEKFRLNLQLFGEGGGAGGAGGTGGEGAGSAEGTAAPGEAGAEAAAKKAAKGSKASDLSEVKYGKQDEAEQQPEAEPEEPAKEPEKAPRKSFDQLLKDDAEYQREMQKRIDNAINKRFARSKAAEEQNAKLAPALRMLEAKYGVSAGDTDALIEAINGDSDLIEQQAMDAGMEPDAYREYTRIQAELQMYKQQEAERQRNEELTRAQNEWFRQAQEAQAVYPNLDLREEAKNEQFRELLGAGIPVKTAYEVVHQDEIMRGIVQHAAADAQKETLAKIASKQGRPRENATGKNRAAAIKSDISSLTTRDFDEIMRRAARGERIRF